MRKYKSILVLILIIIAMQSVMQSCATQKKTILEKTGAQLWGENCIRCHNSPSPNDFTDADWKTIGLHMQDRANLTKVETDKIVEFLSSVN